MLELIAWIRHLEAENTKLETSDGNSERAMTEHPGTKLRKALSEQGLSVTEVARRLGIGRPALSNWLNGNSSTSIDMALSVERVFGLPAKQLLEQQLEYEYYRRLKPEFKCRTCPKKATVYMIHRGEHYCDDHAPLGESQVPTKSGRVGSGLGEISKKHLIETFPDGRDVDPDAVLKAWKPKK